MKVDPNASRPGSTSHVHRRVLVAIAAGAVLLASASAAATGSARLQAASPSPATLPASPSSSASPASGSSATPTALQVGTLAGSLPAPLSREAVVAGSDGASIVILGGLKATGDTTGDILRLDTATGSARPMGTLRKPVHDVAAATLGGTTLVVGGGHAVPESVVQAVDGTGVAHLSGHLPTPRADLAAVSVGDQVIVVGGGTDAGPDPAILATSDGTAFQKIGTLAVGVRYPAVATLGGLVYVIGGQGDTAGRTEIQRLDPATGTVDVIGNLPRALSAAAALVVDGRLLVLGGRHGSTASDAILEVDPASGGVTRLGHLPYPVASAAAVVVGDTGYLIGGEGDSLAASIDTTVTLAFLPGNGAAALPLADPSASPSTSALASSPVLASAGDSPAPSPAPASDLPGASPAASPASAAPSASPNVYAAITSGVLSPAVANMPERVYVPNEKTGNVVVIDPTTFQIIDRFKVGRSPEHIAPAWDLSKLYVDNMKSNSLTIIDPTSGHPVGIQKVFYPYNLYFTLDGSKAIVVLDFRTGPGGSPALNRLDFYDRLTWHKLGSLVIPWGGADHLDMSADGTYLLLSTEFAGVVVKVDTRTMKIVGKLRVGGLPIDVRLSPDGRVFYVTNQLLNGVSVIDPVTMQQLDFLQTGAGAHGLVISRDATKLYVSNRLAGTISVIDTTTRKVVDTWNVGGSPDMLTVSTDGSQLWTSNRYDGSVSVIDSATGKVLKVIRTGDAPHGLVYYPQPGNLSLGHNGVFR